MGIGTVLIGLALFLIAAILVISPLLEPRRSSVEAPSRREVLEHERQAIIRTIRELDMDFRTGKLNAGDYKELREAQVQQGANTLRELDSLNQQIDAEAPPVPKPQPSDTCPECGAPIQPAGRFCPNCGYPIAHGVQPSLSRSR